MSAPTRRAAVACTLAGAALAGRADAALAGRRPMFAAEILAQADAADVYVAPRTLLTRTAITPDSLVRLVKPVPLRPGSDGWASLMRAMGAAGTSQTFAHRPETRLGVVLSKGGATLASAFLALSDTAEHGRVFAVVDGRDAATDVAAAKTLQSFAAEGLAV